MSESLIKKKLLFILEAGEVFPTGYIRGLIYRDLLEKNGFEVRSVSRLFVPLLRLEIEIKRIFPAGLAALLARAIHSLQRPIAWLAEFRLVSISKDYDIIYMSKVMDGRTIKKIRRRTGAYIVYDFGDALWLKRWVDTQSILAAVDTVTTDNEYTASYIKRFNKNCTIVPDSPQIEEFDKRRHEIAKGAKNLIVIGWIGSPSSFYNLRLVYNPLERLFSKYDNLSLRLLGVGYNVKFPAFFKKINYSAMPSYNQSEMIDEVLAMDIGLFPLYDTDLLRSHGILKAAIYMSGEAAVVSSPVGQCSDFIKDGINGMIAGSENEWEHKLELLITDPALRKRIAKNGLQDVRANFSLEQNFKILLEVLRRGGRPDK